MALTFSNQAVVAFKNISGKSNTDVTKGVNNESEGIFFNVDSSKVWTSNIGPTPSISVLDSIAVPVTASLIYDVTSNGHSFFAVWPSVAPSGIDPTTLISYTYGSGLLTNISSGNRVTDSISPVYGLLYEGKPYDTSSNLIPPGDPREWIYQYQSGVFFQQTNPYPSTGASPSYISLYAYFGKNLSQASINGSADGFLVNYYIEPNKKIIVPTYSQYWVYGDLTIAGELENHGQVVIANGGLVLSGGTFSGMTGSLSFVNWDTGITYSFQSTDTITFSVSNTIFGTTVSAMVRDGSLTASHLNTNGTGATAGYFLSVDGDGVFKWDQVSTSGDSMPYYNQRNLSITPSIIQPGSNNQNTGITISYTPSSFSRLNIYVNGQLQYLGDGLTSSVDCYISFTSSVSEYIYNIQSGQTLWWNGGYSGFDLNISDKIDIIYEK